MAKNKLKFSAYLFIAIILTLGLSISFQSLLADFTPPSNNPPTCPAGDPGCDVPLSVGPSNQQKQGMLLLNTAGNTNGLIVQSGNVGIGTTGPNSKLEVVGDVRVGSNNKFTTANGRSFGYVPVANGVSGYGIYSLDSDFRLSFYDGVDIYTAMFLESTNGNVGIGTTGPNAPLHVYTSNSEIARFQTTNTDWGAVYFYGNTGNNIGRIGWGSGGYIHSPAIDNSLRIRGENGLSLGAGGVAGINITTTGNVGIGTTAPGQKLDVRGNIDLTGDVYMDTNKAVRIDSATHTNLILGNFNDGGFAYGGTYNLNLAVEGDVKANRFCIGDADCKSDWTSIGGASGWTDDGTTVRLTTASDNVGIGTASPSGKLHVVGTGSYGQLELQASDSVGSYLTFHEPGIKRWSIGIDDGSNILKFREDSTSGATAMVIDSLGNVGIGTIAPGYKLDVQGTLGVTGAATFSSTLSFTDKGAGSNQLIKMGANQLGGMYQISDRGGMMITSADDTLVLADGDIGRNFGANINPDGESTFIVSDGSVLIKTGLQSGWGSENNFIFRNDGRLGIGTTAPGQELDVRGNIDLTGDVYMDTNKAIRIDSAAHTNLILGNFNDGGFAYGGTYNLNLAVEGDVKANRFCIGDADCKSDWTSIGGASGWTDDGTTVRLTTASDNVGIGTATPSHKLTVMGSGYFLGDTSVPNAPTSLGFYLGKSLSDENRRMEVVSPSGGVSYIDFTEPGVDYRGRLAYYLSDNSFRFYTNSSEKVRIDSSGNVGIGTTAPSQKLHVAGNIRTSGDIIVDGNYGLGLVGLYSATRYQNVFAMGSAYRLTSDGTSPGNLYGIAWTHSNIGGQSKAGLSHQALFMTNGVTQTAIGTGIWTNGNLTINGGDFEFWFDNTSDTTAAIDTALRLRKNDGTGNLNKYINTAGGVSPVYETDGFAYNELYNPGDGIYRFRTATNGLAGNAISWLETLALRDGNVGIGTTAPGYKLDVNGTVYASQYYGGACDIAERYNADDEEKGDLGPGDILSLSRSGDLKVGKSKQAYDTMVIGVFSTDPMLTMGEFEGSNNEDNPPVALLGRVPTKVTNENGAIEIGDLIVSSSKEGHGMKCDEYSKCQGAVVGKALENFNQKEGVIEVLINVGM